MEPRQALLSPRWFLVLAATLAAAATLGGGVARAATATATTRLNSPQAAEIARGGSIPDSQLSSAASFGLHMSSGYWGGEYTTSGGEQVLIYASDEYPVEPARAQRWADFLASLVHGSELASLTAYLAPLSEVQGICGFQALACYSSTTSTLIAPGDDPGSTVSAEAVVAHEYGHHVAAHRSDAPWPAIDYGTKRWSSYEQVCAKTRANELVPGAEDVPDYTRNPGEAFAETYRVLNERKLGLQETTWDIVTETLYPDPTALALLEQDVTVPWTKPTTTTLTGSFRPRGASLRTFTLATSLDGTLAVTLRSPPRSRISLRLLDGSGHRLGATATTPGARSAGLKTTICGTRTLRLQVTRTSGSGTFRLTVSRP